MTSNRGPRTRPPQPHRATTGPTRGPAAGRLLDTTHVLDNLCDQFQRRYDTLLDTTIARHGWALQGVDSEPAAPGYLYTVGLHAFDHHPELVVIGLRVHAAATLLNTLGDQIRAGHRLATRHQCADFPGWPRLALLDVDPGNCAALLPAANRRYQTPDGPPVDALQVIWCDPLGHLPWEPGWALPHTAQPVLHFPHDDFPDPGDHTDDPFTLDEDTHDSGLDQDEPDDAPTPHPLD
ncbi:DUF4262 domain-containing protein [Frankia sp. CNm7]|uniref:DUF4262 domain-containing protein n=1 Tax=Frankia nepalensis TaxID=1836974 RepID=A0A937UPD8_9ACTN|nr:DUF4262 domain-containing protein [Frankia nepalensis]MBL7502597.1 DUF4262 domain-containing protein [Frankia nepalensis]MBL7514752.1 DUF4262 domain-containing protein [Frankia nepalensis]MBL7524601.1 DUF4262 domain-containing protein [Frankia nepalensis]MBL7628967.1 DUF4262 domain-containing protein [Frankia nepalensis]